MKFSQRQGINPIEKSLQIESIDSDLRNGLWNIYRESILDEINYLDISLSAKRLFFTCIYHNYFKKVIDGVPYDFQVNLHNLRNFFLIEAKWYEVYELLEVSIESISGYECYNNIDTLIFQFEINLMLEKEFSVYRFIDGIIVHISNDSEIEEIKNATYNTKQFTAFLGCNIHLTEALKILSDRKTVDYRNSIKESISAIESLTKAISGKNSDTLGSALTKVKDKIGLHAALERGFKQLYGYTSDADGIRHGLMDAPNCDFDDAKYMLVSSSAFINYLIAKATKAGIHFV